MSATITEHFLTKQKERDRSSGSFHALSARRRDGPACAVRLAKQGGYGTPVAAVSESSGAELETAWRTVVAGVSRAQQSIDRAVEESGVAPTWFAVLFELLLARGHRLPMSTLASRVAMTPGGFSKLADRMAREGLIDRRGSTSDRRVIHVTLTGEGLAVGRRARRAYQKALRASVLDAMNPADLTAAAAAFTGLAPQPPNVDSSLDQPTEPFVSGRQTRSAGRRRTDRRDS
jgi:DNA-binding MarR family transcriptional regulator